MGFKSEVVSTSEDCLPNSTEVVARHSLRFQNFRLNQRLRSGAARAVAKPLHHTEHTRTGTLSMNHASRRGVTHFPLAAFFPRLRCALVLANAGAASHVFPFFTEERVPRL